MDRDAADLPDPNAEYTMRDLSAGSMGLDSRDDRPTITDIQTTVVDGTFPWTIVRVYTDDAAGTGEAYWGAGVPALIDRMRPFVVGECPLDIDRLVEHLIQKMSGEGSIAGPTVTAIAGIEIALHDLAGRLIDVPAYQLLGGKYRDTVRVYCDAHAGEEGDPDSTAATADRLADRYDALKFDLDVPTGSDGDRANRHLRPAAIDRQAAIVERVTERVGDRAQVAFDCHWSYTAESAQRLAAACEQSDVWWLEDPVPPENHDVQRRVTRETSTPIAAGENVYRVHGHRRLIEEGAVDVIAPDVPKVGGMRETRQIADLADTYYIPVAFHNVASPVGTMATAHVAAAVSNTLAVEFHSEDLDWWDELVEERVIVDGQIPVPDDPGLGVTVDRDVLAEHALSGETLIDPV
ncbi:mandelate racemase/muconate lactonizing enzyme family protein [Halococcoides cellulosivorans]|uniref:Enolase n=1 Tax=Halococcoides cellulosivorans TaxID=1679096 RepID=A0A2R4X2U4_9EURY|nr:mandelate racemase/muconate lactonizing enzyme family protein [Halococcoides cellulosivorans]AWB28111.1 enolase [Halococcoides cellulosivorans]